MISGSRNRRDWRVILWLSLASALISAYFGYAVGEGNVPGWRSALSGVFNSLVIATPILLFEVKGQSSGSCGGCGDCRCFGTSCFGSPSTP